MMGRTLLLIRHPEAIKNVQDRHGGNGTALTQKGIQQCSRLAEHIFKHYGPLDSCRLYGHQVRQVREATVRLSELLSVKTIWNEKLKGLNLGVLSGLSRAEALEQYPEAASRLEMWRAGRLTIDQLNLPQAEPVTAFRSRIEEILQEWLGMQDVALIIAVCTRSVLIMLTNLISLWDAFDYEKYRVAEFSDASLSVVEILDYKPKLLAINQSADQKNDLSR